MHHAKRNNYGNEGKAVQKETAGQSEKLEPESCEHRPDDTRKLKLGRIQRYRVCKIFSAHEIKSHRLVRRTGERHTASSHKRKSQDHPDSYVICPNQNRQSESRKSGHDLCVEKQAPAVNQVGKNASGKRQKEARRGGHEAINAQPQC